MAQLQMPLSIWLSATPSERDSFYLNAGFDPNLPVVDNGTDTQFVRFRQGDPIAVVASVAALTPIQLDSQWQPEGYGPHVGGTGQYHPFQHPTHHANPAELQAGDDLRDIPQAQSVSLIGDNPITNEFGEPIAGTGLAIAGRALRLVLGGGGGRLTSAIWNSLPSLVRSALTQAGIGVGVLIAFSGDIPFITLPGQGSSPAPFIGPPLPPVDIQVGASPMQSVQVVGSWVANGVVFYRLADGKIAVQNKKGRWKVWRPKRPIVLYADGASSLKTMLRADKALNKQAKKIAAMLNRRAPRRKSSASSASNPIILGNNARVVDV